MRPALSGGDDAGRPDLPDGHGECWLVFCCAEAPGAVGVVGADGAVRAAHACTIPSGLGDALPLAVRHLLAGHAVDALACVTGPGSFTGIRAALALAHGLALGRGLPLIGVTAAEAAAAGHGLAGVVAAARARRAGALPPLAPLPLYDGPPRVSAPSVPPRPPPVP